MEKYDDVLRVSMHALYMILALFKVLESLESTSFSSMTSNFQTELISSQMKFEIYLTFEFLDQLLSHDLDLTPTWFRWWKWVFL